MDSTGTVTQIGKYKILAVLGRGGMGVVYRAEDKYIGREVAIKTLVDATPEMRQRFAIEARSGVLNHPNVVTIYDFGEHEDNPYIVMEFLHGPSLEAIVKENQPLSLVDKLDIMRQVCEGLGYAHSRGVVHRDIKPANIVVLGNGCVKLVDFGIAQLETLSGHTMAGSVIGTYQYLSPERLKGEPADGRADIWAAGVVLYLLLTGKLPFPGEDISALHRVITDAYPPLGTLLSTAYPASLDNIIARALAKDPAGRYPTALEMAGDLESTRDAIRLSRMEDLLGQVRSLIDKDELLRARPLLLDLQRLAPQNTAVRNMLRELGQRLQHLPEAANGAGLAEAPSPLLNGTGVPDPERLAALQEEERRRRIIAQIVVEIRGQAERGNGERALQLVQRSLERAPQNVALLELQSEIEAMIAAARPHAEPVAEAAMQPVADVAAEPVGSPGEAAPPPIPPGEAIPAPLPKPDQPPQSVIPAVAPNTPGIAPGLRAVAQVPDEPTLLEAAPKTSHTEPIFEPEVVTLAAEPRASLPIPEPEPFAPEPPPATPPVVVRSQAAPPAAPFPESMAPLRVTPEPLPLAVPAAVTPLPAAALKIPVPAQETPVLPAGPASRFSQSGLLFAGAAIAVLLAAVFLLSFRRHATPAPVPVTYAQVIATPYAHILRMTSDDGAAVTLAPGDHLTPLRVNNLPPGNYTLDLQAGGGPVTQTHCRLDMQQHLCFASLAPLSDADVQAILNGASHP